MVTSKVFVLRFHLSSIYFCVKFAAVTRQEGFINLLADLTPFVRKRLETFRERTGTNNLVLLLPLCALQVRGVVYSTAHPLGPLCLPLLLGIWNPFNGLRLPQVFPLSSRPMLKQQRFLHCCSTQMPVTKLGNGTALPSTQSHHLILTLSLYK